MALNSTGQGDAAALRHISEGKMAAVEIGTFTGSMAEIIADSMHPEGHLITIDSYLVRPEVHWGNSRGKITPVTFTVGEAILQATNRLEPYRSKVTQIIGDSVKVSEMIKDKSLDLIFIDGAHDYKSVMADLQAWLPKLKPGGTMSGHDYNFQERYINPKYAKKKSTEERDLETNIHFGVSRALHETFKTWNSMNDMSTTVWWCGLEDLR